MIDSEFVKIAVEAPIPHLLTYRLPRHLAADATLGARVSVPLGKRFSRGVLVSTGTQEEVEKKTSNIKSVGSISGEPSIGHKTLRWLKWLSNYYLHPPGQVYSLAFAPAGESRKRKSKKISPTEFLDKCPILMDGTPRTAAIRSKQVRPKTICNW